MIYNVVQVALYVSVMQSGDNIE